MHYPVIDPIIVAIGPLAVRWYGLAYIAAFAVSWWLGNRQADRDGSGWTRDDVSDIVFYVAVGAVLGGRVGYMLFYQVDALLQNPLNLFKIWEGGMSFHGGLLGTVLAMFWFGIRTKRHVFQVSDFVAPLVPIGLGFGRLGNFINTELPGRATDSVFGLIYPCDALRGVSQTCLGQWEAFARHPSPLYQAFSEGLVLFAIVWFIASKPRTAGVVSGSFLIAYGSLRFCTEYFREPDSHLGFIAFDWLTMGQLLSLPMVIVGILIVVVTIRRQRLEVVPADGITKP